jgi:hypothetical protein
MQKKLYLFIEGEWDKVFFETFLDEYLRKEYNFEEIIYFEFAEDLNPRAKLRELVREQRQVNFLLCPDLDSKYDEIKRIQKLKKLADGEFKVEFEQIKNKSFVIVQKIESWYLAGFNETFCNKKGITFYMDTEMTTKGTFEKIAKQLKKAPLRLRDELTRTYRNNFDIDEAKKRNQSFRKFFEKVANQSKRLS